MNTKYLTVLNMQRLKTEAAAGNSINPGTSAYGLTTAEQAGVANGTSTDWQKLIYQQGMVTNQNISLNGGNEKPSIPLEEVIIKRVGVIPGTGFYPVCITHHTRSSDQQPPENRNQHAEFPYLYRLWRKPCWWTDPDESAGFPL